MTAPLLLRSLRK